MNVVNNLLNYNNLKIVQNNNFFKFSLDSVLLSCFVETKECENILDIGTGNAPIPLILSTKTKSKITAVEIQKEAFCLAEESIQINKLEDQITIINEDIKNLYQEMENECFDIITCNPPYFKTENLSRINSTINLSLARHEISLNLEDIMKISKKLLKNKGSLYLVHRPERLIEIFEQMTKHNIIPKKIQFVQSKQNKESKTVLIKGVKNGNKGLKVLPIIISHEKNGEYTKEILKMFSNEVIM